MVLIDSSAWIEFIRPGGSPVAKARVRQLLETGLAATCGVVSVEVLRGARHRRDFEALSEAFAALPQLPLDEAVIARAAAWGFDLDKKGTALPTTDLLIAAAAFEKAVLLHADRDFELIAATFGLAQERIVL